MSVSMTQAVHYASAEQIARAHAAISPIDKLNALYGLDRTTALQQTFAALNINSTMMMYIAKALIFRNEFASVAQEAMYQLEALGLHSVAFQDLRAVLHTLEGKLLGIFVSDEMPQAMHHTLAHGVDMAHDAVDFLLPFLQSGSAKSAARTQLVTLIVGLLGAAHDVVQGKSPPPTNEMESAEIFCLEMQITLKRLLRERAAAYQPAEVVALEGFMQQAVPFLAQEGIINSTHLMFGSGKRTLDSVLMQISQLYLGNVPDLSPLIAAMKLALSVSDTRRGEMVPLIDKLESLTALIEHGQAVPMTLFLRAAGIFSAAEALPAEAITLINEQGALRKQYQTAEGFILRLRASLNMVSELAHTVGMDGQGKRVLQPDPLGAELTHQLRANLAAGNDEQWSVLLNQFIARINATSEIEMGFAKSMSELHQEMVEQAKRYGIAAMLESQYLNSDWNHQVALLVTLKNRLTELPRAEKIAMARTMYIMAAISPGLIAGMGMTQALYEGLVSYEQELYLRGKQSEKLQRLSREINEVEWLNREKLKWVDRAAGCRVVINTTF